MRINLRWQIVLAVLGFTLVAALLSYQQQVQRTSFCTVTEPALGGTYTEGIVGAPRYLNPLLSDDNPVDSELVKLIFDGLTRYNEQGQLVPALAQSWLVSDDGLTITFKMREGVTWHDGEAVTAEDVAFSYGLMADPGFSGPASLQRFWQSVTIAVIDPMTIQFTLAELYSPFLAATTRGILPSHLLQGVTAATLVQHDFNRAPVGTGPFLVPAGQDPARTGRLRLLPSPATWPQGTKIGDIAFRFYPDDASLLDAFAAGEIQAVNGVAPAMLPQMAERGDVRLFTAPAGRLTTLLFNLSGTELPAVSQLEVRQALAYALNREQLVDEVLHGQGVALEGPFLPTSWAYSPALLTGYLPDQETAVALLDAAGWPQPEGAELRLRDETELSLRLLLLDTPTQRAMAAAIARQWQSVGVGVAIETAASLTELREMLATRNFDVALLDIVPPADPDLYDFWSQEAIVRGQNYGGWNNRRASEALENGRQSWDQATRKPFYESFLRRYNEELPALTLYQHINTYAVSRSVYEVDIGRIDHPRDRYQTLAGWFLAYEDASVLCLEETTAALTPTPAVP